MSLLWSVHTIPRPFSLRSEAQPGESAAYRLRVCRLFGPSRHAELLNVAFGEMPENSVVQNPCVSESSPIRILQRARPNIPATYGMRIIE
jgi:hypothetical protein